MALVTRGDDAQRSGDAAGSLRYYRRALVVDPGSAQAADRLAFALVAGRSAADSRAAIEIATAALRTSPNDTALLADRGLAEQHLGRWAQAERDFGVAGLVGHDPRYDHLAGRVALRRHDRAAARRYFARALAADPAFAPARAALAQR
jgi:tetratricopeptide (TPR) repeat protein